MSEQSTKPTRLIRMPEVTDRTGLKKSAIYARIAKGEFPKQIPLGTARNGISVQTAWIESEVEAWIQSTIAAARNETVLTA
ncbi:helix-turn-helix transcriptional regulator [Marinomonas atlantica]|uniref:helix-turn-helix transcriptional regulator n=1 Tax=Marinomonas atlantica TaxID=1806668 RepID=UPI00082F6004|nr:AlpA family transcriptional regulator [Marinomonas atlantica]